VLPNLVISFEALQYLDFSIVPWLLWLWSKCKS